MLINCPECSKNVSDKAPFCPGCGYPISPGKTIRKSNRKKRLPNGFGQISFIKGNLRRPYRAMVTVGKTDEGRPIVKPLKPEAYFETYNDAYEALLNYNKATEPISKDMILSDLYNEWIQKRKVKNADRDKIAWKRAKALHDMKISEIRSFHIRDCIDALDIAPNAKASVKMLFNLLFDYAMERDIVSVNYARNIKMGSIVEKDSLYAKSPHIVYSDEEIKLIFSKAKHDNLFLMIAIQCYTGFRPSELISIKTEDVDLSKWFMKGGSKTKAGKNRLVPIHKKIRGLVERAYGSAIENNSKTLFFREVDGRITHYTYASIHEMYALRIRKYCLNENHRLHDGRKHFVTLAKRWKVDDYAIKYIVGHSINDITEGIYTERSEQWLTDEMNKIENVMYE